MDLKLTDFMREKLKNTSLGFHRYMYDKINWERQMFGLMGPRGVGKTTLILQYIAEHIESKKIFYVSADHIYFASHTLIEVAEDFIKEGGEQLFIDEIHKYTNWSSELKQIYDTYPKLQVGFTGSSVLEIQKGEADLSRRAVVYSMNGLSFREYLKMFHGIDLPVLTLNEILSNNHYFNELEHPLPLFKEYLTRGYYPFGNDSEYHILLNQTVTQTMENDIPQYADMTPATGRKLKRLLNIVAESVPFKPVMDNLATVLGISRNIIPNYFLYMEKAGMIAQLRDETGGIRGLGKVEKVYLDNTNLAYALSRSSADIGNIRETFFMNQMRVNNDVTSSKVSDFMIDNYTFEVGGKNKGKKQIGEIDDAYIVKDDIEYGAGNIMPMWMFGLNY